MNILLVGHHHELTSLVMSTLCLSYDVESIRSPKDAVARLTNRWLEALVYVTPTFAAEPIHELRAATDAPLLVISETGSVDDVVAFLDAGADDYLAKPVRAQELLARLRAAIRKADRHRSTHFATKDFTLDLEGRRMFAAGGEEIFPTRTEWAVLNVLAEHAGQVMDYAEVIEAVWGSGAKGGVERLRMNVMAIRRKIEPRPRDPHYLVTVPGRGILLDLPASGAGTSDIARLTRPDP